MISHENGIAMLGRLRQGQLIPGTRMVLLRHSPAGMMAIRLDDYNRNVWNGVQTIDIESAYEQIKNSHVVVACPRCDQWHCFDITSDPGVEVWCCNRRLTGADVPKKKEQAE